MTERIMSALLDMYDIQNALDEKTKNLPKDSYGTDITIGDCIADVISTLRRMQNETK